MRYFVLPVGVLIIVAFIILALYRHVVVQEVEARNRIISTRGIQSLEIMELGGVAQWIYIRGEYKEKPLLLFVHGGPGSPEMPMAKKKYQGNLEKEKPLETGLEVKIPVYFCTGSHDYDVPFELTEKLYQRIKAPRKRLIWFRNSAHSPHMEEPDRFYQAMMNRILKESFNE